MASRPNHASGLIRRRVRYELPNGQTKEKDFYGHTDAEVNRKIAEFRLELSQGMLFSRAAGLWQQDHEKQIGGYTQSCYKAPLRDLVDEFGEKRLSQITPMDIQRFLDRLASLGLARQTVALRRIVANLIFKWAVLHGETLNNPVDAAVIPRRMKRRKRELPTDDVLELISKSWDAPFGLFACFLYYTGCREGEALAVEPARDIDTKRKILSISREVVFYNGRPEIVEATKTDAGYREIILPDILLERLPLDKPGLLFTENGGPISKGRLRTLWLHYCKAIGQVCRSDTRKDQALVPTITPHQLRHGYATILFDADVSDKDAQDLLGHSDITVTRNIYTHIRSVRKEQTAEKINEYINNSNMRKNTL